jgi:hypothetical protein
MMLEVELVLRMLTRGEAVHGDEEEKTQGRGRGREAKIWYD